MQRPPYSLIFERNIGAISANEQRRLKDSCVAIVGLGGIGGIAFDVLVRSGIGRFILIDKDKFEASNLNRQLLSTSKVLGKKKVDVAMQIGKAINPEVKIKPHYIEFNEKNSSIIKDADVIVDGTDNILSRIILSRAARKYGISYIFGAVECMKGISTIFPESGKGYENIFARFAKGKGIAEIRNKPKNKPPSVLGPVPNMIGCFEAIQAVNLLLSRKVVEYPEFLHLDMNGKTQIWIGKI